jgi:hypothetical protein
VAVLLDAEMITRRNRQIQQDFPQLNPALAGLQQDEVAAHVGGIRQDFQRERLEKEARRVAEDRKTVEKKFGATTVVKLLKLCNVASIAELPPIYPQWSGEPKAQHLESLQTALDEEKQECKEDGLQLITTAALLTTCQTVSLVMVSPDSIQTGLNPFRLHEHGDEEQAMTAQSTYKICHNEGGTPSLTDAQEMIQPSAEAPVALFQARQQALRQMIYVAVLQGRNHPLVNALAAYNLRFGSMEGKLQAMMASKPLLPSLLMKRLSMSLSTWYANQLRQPHLYPVPNFIETLDAIESEQPWEPLTPPRFLKALGLTSLPARTPVPALPRAPALPRPAPGGGAPAAPAGAFLNTNFNAIFQPYKDSAITCRDLRGRIGAGPNPLPPLPSSRIDGASMCLAFHAKGVCNPNCGRIADHVSYTEAQYAPLLRWCVECYTA